MAETETVQQLAHGLLTHRLAELGFHTAFDVDSAPADHPILPKVGTGLDPFGNLGLLPLRQPRRAARQWPVTEPTQALIIITMHPVAQRLPVHAT